MTTTLARDILIAAPGQSDHFYRGTSSSKQSGGLDRRMKFRRAEAVRATWTEQQFIEENERIRREIEEFDANRKAA